MQLYLMLILVGASYFINTSNALAQEGNEYQVKAALIFNLARMVEWPNSKLVSAGTPINFCFYGEDFFKQDLDIIKGKRVGDRPVFLKRNISIKEFAQCQLLFISRSESERLASILPYVENLPVLTVSDFKGFAEQGGIVNLARQGTSVKIEVNLRNAKNAGLTISSRLLTISVIVENAS